MPTLFSTRLPPFPDAHATREAEDGRWSLSMLVRIRFVHILLQAALLLPALHFGWMFAADLPWYLGALAGLGAFNALSLLWLRAGNRAPPLFLLVQTAADLTAMTLLFGVSGGLTNPLHSLVHFQIGLAGILLPFRTALATLALGCGALAALGWSAQRLGDPYAWIGPLGPNLAYEWLLACAVAGLSIFAARLNRHYRDRLRDAQERGRQRDRLRAAGAVASGFCHELASPLNAAGLLAERLRRKTSESASGLAEEWDELRESLARCDHIVRTMAGAPWDPEELSLQTTDAGLLLRQIAQGWNGRVPLFLEISGAAVTEDPAGIPENIFPQVFQVAAPPLGLGQTLLSLVRNAEEASPEGAGILLEIKAGRDSVELTVSDRGQGMHPAVLRALGSPFNSRKGEGRGLGLFAALHFTESLGGTLAFAAREGGGTVARLTLPRAAGLYPESAA
jgi:two-component system sensor histidine kinase RegB